MPPASPSPCPEPPGRRPLPDAIAAFAAEQSQVCTGLGGAPRVGPAFATAVDLNGDGALDYIVDLAGIECANAWSAFCGSAGCPVSVWIAGPEGIAQEWGDYAQGWRIDAVGSEVALVVDQHGGSCPGSDAGAETCAQRLTFDAPRGPGRRCDRAGRRRRGGARGRPAPAPRAAPAEALAASGVAGWTLRGGAGRHAGRGQRRPGRRRDGGGVLPRRPALARRAAARGAGAPRPPRSLSPSPAQTVSSAARREDSAGGALIVELADRPLAGLLSGRDRSADVSIDGAEQGVLSLRGSTRAIRGALESCMAL